MLLYVDVDHIQRNANHCLTDAKLVYTDNSDVFQEPERSGTVLSMVTACYILIASSYMV